MRATRLARRAALAPRSRRAAGLIAALVVVAQLAATPAQADVGETIILRCTHNESLAGFSQSAYKKALKELSADTEEYSDCSSLIRRAQEAAASSSGSGTQGGGSGSTGATSAAALPATAAESHDLSQAAHRGSGAVSLGTGAAIRPGEIHANVSSAFSTLPSSLIATLAFALVLLLLTIARTVRARTGDRRPD